MVVRDIVQALDLKVVAGADSLDRQVTGGYASDLLSCVMAGAQAGNIWVTLQAHVNVVAVAALLELAGVIITENVHPDEDVLARANEKGVPLLLAKATTFRVVGQLVGLGIDSAR